MLNCVSEWERESEKITCNLCRFLSSLILSMVTSLYFLNAIMKRLSPPPCQYHTRVLIKDNRRRKEEMKWNDTLVDTASCIYSKMISDALSSIGRDMIFSSAILNNASPTWKSTLTPSQKKQSNIRKTHYNINQSDVMFLGGGGGEANRIPSRVTCRWRGTRTKAKWTRRLVYWAYRWYVYTLSPTAIARWLQRLAGPPWTPTCLLCNTLID